MVEFCELCVIFLSTPSARWATLAPNRILWKKLFLSTPSARRATTLATTLAKTYKISIHALCEEGDYVLPVQEKHETDFYPRPLRGGRPLVEKSIMTEWTISIHALCEEGDVRRWFMRCTSGDFYPRPLRGGRPLMEPCDE